MRSLGTHRARLSSRSTAPLAAQVCLSRSEDLNPEICSPNSSYTSTEADEAGERSGTERDGCLAISFEVGGGEERRSLCAWPGGLKDETALLWPVGIVTGSSQQPATSGAGNHTALFERKVLITEKKRLTLTGPDGISGKTCVVLKA